MAVRTFRLRGEFIELKALLKLLALAPSGGAAKVMVAEGLVTVDGEVETRKARKLRPGMTVRAAGDEIRITGEGDVTTDAPSQALDRKPTPRVETRGAPPQARNRR